jgi:hypothetical protein
MLRLVTDEAPEATQQAAKPDVVLHETLVSLRRSAALPSIPGHLRCALEAIVEAVEAHMAGAA